MSLPALNAGLSGLNANQQALAVAGHNVANASTKGFQPQRASFQEASPAGNGVTLSIEGRGLATGVGESATDLPTELTNSLVYKAGVGLAAKVIQAADERIGTLIDIKA